MLTMLFCVGVMLSGIKCSHSVDSIAIHSTCTYLDLETPEGFVCVVVMVLTVGGRFVGGGFRSYGDFVCILL